MAASFLLSSLSLSLCTHLQRHEDVRVVGAGGDGDAVDVGVELGWREEEMMRQWMGRKKKIARFFRYLLSFFRRTGSSLSDFLYTGPVPDRTALLLEV